MTQVGTVFAVFKFHETQPPAQARSTIPTEKLLGEGISPFDLNDDVVGRTLDAIYRCGATELSNQIALHVMGQFSLGTQLIHVDTTNFSVYGKYENDAPDATDSIRIAFGHAKDGRMDLKRFVLGLVTTQFGLPLFAMAFSANESDKNSIIHMIQKTQQALDFDDKNYWVADSALYTENNIQFLGTEMKLILRFLQPSGISRSCSTQTWILFLLQIPDMPSMSQI